jgi:hypothetical protein
MSYKWNNPYSWLKDAVSEGKVTVDELLRLIEFVDADNIQYVFENKMEADGYFEKQSN